LPNRNVKSPRPRHPSASCAL